MEVVEQFFGWLYEALTSIMDFLISFVTDLVYIVDLTGTFVLKIPIYLGWLPSQVLSIIVVCFGIVVLYKILRRRDNNGYHDRSF